MCVFRCVRDAAKCESLVLLVASNQVFSMAYTATVNNCAELTVANVERCVCLSYTNVSQAPASLAPDMFCCHMSEMLASLDAC